MCKAFGFLCFIILIIFSGCDGSKGESYNFMFYEFYELDKNGLIPEVEYTFHPFDSDSLLLHNLSFDVYLDLRFTENCELKSLPLYFEYFSEEKDTILHKQLTVDLFNETDKAEAKGNFGVYEKKQLLISDFKLGENSFITITTPEKKTSGIISLGLTAEPLN